MTLGQWEDIWRKFCEYSFWTECHGFYVVPWGRLWMIWISLYGKLLWWKADYISWWEFPFWEIILIAKMSKKFPFLENFSRSGFPFWEFFRWLKCWRISFFGIFPMVKNFLFWKDFYCENAKKFLFWKFSHSQNAGNFPFWENFWQLEFWNFLFGYFNW